MNNPLMLLLLGLVPALVLLLAFWPEGGFIRKWRCMRRSLKVLVEDALKYIVTRQMEISHIPVDDLAQALGCRPEKYDQVLEFLEQNDLASLNEGLLALTDTGREYATFVLRAHRLYERYLADRTGYSEDEWHERAEWHEHSLTSEDLERIAVDLHYPNRDPHGDPIPSPDGRIFTEGWLPLDEAPEGVALLIEHIEDEPPSEYVELRSLGLYPGMHMMILDRGDHGVQLEAGGRTVELSSLLARQVSVAVSQEDLPPSVEAGVPLSSLEPGEMGMVVDLLPQIRGAERRRLMDFGLLPGTEILTELRSPAGDPTAYRIRGSLIALREGQARYIRVRHIGGSVTNG